MEIINTRMTITESARNTFMRKVIVQVWEKLQAAGIEYNYGDMRNGSIEIMENLEAIEEVSDVFYDRFIS